MEDATKKVAWQSQAKSLNQAILLSSLYTGLQSNKQHPEPSIGTPSLAGSQPVIHMTLVVGSSALGLSFGFAWHISIFNFQVQRHRRRRRQLVITICICICILRRVSGYWRYLQRSASVSSWKKNETIFLFLAKSAAPTSLQRLLYSISYSKPMLTKKKNILNFILCFLCIPTRFTWWLMMMMSWRAYWVFGEAYFYMQIDSCHWKYQCCCYLSGPTYWLPLCLVSLAICCKFFTLVHLMPSLWNGCWLPATWVRRNL